MTTTTPTTISKTPNVCGGRARVRNTRIPVWLLVSFHQDGLSDATLLEYYPTLTAADLDAAWVYYADNPAEIDEAIRANEEA